MKSWFTHLLRGIISVPYRGATFLNQTCGLLRYGLTYFRPLSGSYISQSAFYKFKRLSWRFPSPIGELHFSMGLHLWRIQEIWFPSPIGELHFSIGVQVPHIFRNKHFRPLSGSYISQFLHKSNKLTLIPISVPYRGATFLNPESISFRPFEDFRPLSGSYISQYHPRNPMSCLGRIGGLRGKSNFIEIQPFWKVKSSHKSSI